MKEDKIRRREELRNKNRKKSRDIIPMVLTGFMIFLIVALSYTYYLTTPVDKNNTEKVNIEVKESYGSSAISDILYKNKLIKSPTMFKLYSKMSSSSDFYIGNYQISKNMSMSEILSTLTTAPNKEVLNKVIVVEGDNVMKIATKVEKATNITANEFLAKVNDSEFINILKKEFPQLITDRLDDPIIKYKLEGYLFPATYSIDDTNVNNVEELIRYMVKTANSRIVPQFEKTNKNWVINKVANVIDIHDYITMASILEKESTATVDNNGIAAVFLNRLEIGMPLQTDPTVLYSQGRVTGDITFADLQTVDPYNTYTNNGMIPGPIASPSDKSYNALNNVPDTNYFYFLTDSEGKAHFATTFEEHEELAKKYIAGYVPSR